jgi:hypothetical protein
MKTVTFNGAECSLEFLKYANGNNALQLWHEGTPYAMATVNDPDVELEPNQVLIKDYSENSGMVDALVAAGIVIRTEEYALMGPYKAKSWVCNLN